MAKDTIVIKGFKGLALAVNQADVRKAQALRDAKEKGK